MQYFSETAIVSAGQMDCHSAQYAQGERYLEQGLQESAAQGGSKALNYSIGSLALAECILAQQEDSHNMSTPMTLARVRQLLAQVDLAVVESFPGTDEAQPNLYLAQAWLTFEEGNFIRAQQLAAKARPLLVASGADHWELDRLARLDKELSTSRP